MNNSEDLYRSVLAAVEQLDIQVMNEFFSDAIEYATLKADLTEEVSSVSTQIRETRKISQACLLHSVLMNAFTQRYNKN
jgi:hypothetical protein